MSRTLRQISRPNSDGMRSTPPTASVATAASSVELSSRDECHVSPSSGPLFHLSVTSLAELMLASQQTTSQIEIRRDHLHHWHHPNCAHRLCAPCKPDVIKQRGASPGEKFVPCVSFLSIPLYFRAFFLDLRCVLCVCQLKIQ